MYVFQREDLPKWHDLSTSLQEILSHYVDYDQKYPYQDFGPNIKAFWNKVTAAIYGGTDYRTFTYPSGYKNIHQRLLDCETRCTNLENRATALETRMKNCEDDVASYAPRIASIAQTAQNHETTISNHAARIAALEAKKECSCTSTPGGGTEIIYILAGMITYRTAGARTFIVPSGVTSVNAYCVGGGAGGTASWRTPGEPSSVGQTLDGACGGNGGTSYVQGASGTISAGGAVSGRLRAKCTGMSQYYYYYDRDGGVVRTSSSGYYDRDGQWISNNIGYDRTIVYSAIESTPGTGNMSNGNKPPRMRIEGTYYNGYTWGRCSQRAYVGVDGASGKTIPNSDATNAGYGGYAFGNAPSSGSGGAYKNTSWGYVRTPSPYGVMVFGGASGGYSKGTLNTTPGEVLQIRIGGGGAGYRRYGLSHDSWQTGCQSGGSGAVVIAWGIDLG